MIFTYLCILAFIIVGIALPFKYLWKYCESISSKYTKDKENWAATTAVYFLVTLVPAGILNLVDGNRLWATPFSEMRPTALEWIMIYILGLGALPLWVGMMCVLLLIGMAAKKAITST